MELQRNKVCGIDVHKRFLIAKILCRDGKKDIQRFSVTLEDLLKFRDWVIENGCEQVALESTGIYWHPVHSVLEGKIDLIVAKLRWRTHAASCGASKAPPHEVGTS
jgi:transposase